MRNLNRFINFKLLINSMIKGIIFDFDGVIVDTESKKFRDLNKLLVEDKKNLKEKDFSDMVGKKTVLFLSEKFPSMSKKRIEDINMRRKKIQTVGLDQLKLINGIKDLLVFLKSKNYILAITTGTERKAVEKILKITSLSKYFDYIVSGEDFKSSKPNLECYDITLKKMKLSSSEVIVIEDSIAGIKSAKSLGCMVFGIMTYLEKEKLSKADKIFKDHTRILGYLKENLNSL